MLHLLAGHGCIGIQLKNFSSKTKKAVLGYIHTIRALSFKIFNRQAQSCTVNVAMVYAACPLSVILFPNTSLSILYHSCFTKSSPFPCKASFRFHLFLSLFSAFTPFLLLTLICLSFPFSPHLHSPYRVSVRISPAITLMTVRKQY